MYYNVSYYEFCVRAFRKSVLNGAHFRPAQSCVMWNTSLQVSDGSGLLLLPETQLIHDESTWLQLNAFFSWVCVWSLLVDGDESGAVGAL